MISEREEGRISLKVILKWQQCSFAIRFDNKSSDTRRTSAGYRNGDRINEEINKLVSVITFVNYIKDNSTILQSLSWLISFFFFNDRAIYRITIFNESKKKFILLLSVYSVSMCVLHRSSNESLMRIRGYHLNIFFFLFNNLKGRFKIIRSLEIRWNFIGEKLWKYRR